MATEIEKKFLVKNDSWRDQVASTAYYRQGYLSGSGTCSVRVRISGEKAYLNLKSATLGITRTEYEYEIPKDEAEEILDQLCEGPVIEKTRYFVEYGNHTWEIDVFDGANKGLIVAEIELNDVDETFKHPDWLGEEVSDDPRYYNVCLVEHPYSEWQEKL